MASETPSKALAGLTAAPLPICAAALLPETMQTGPAPNKPSMSRAPSV